jgi:lipid-A-disaccharide synthase
MSGNSASTRTTKTPDRGGHSTGNTAGSARAEGAPTPDVTATAPSRRGRVILFTAFEPSGDAHAAPVIAALKERDPDLSICAWGGPRMADAGAQLIESTADDGAMGLGGFAKALTVRKHIKAIDAWSKDSRVVLHVPVDSPAANFPVSKILKPRGVRVAHLVAPQIWAWGPWRIHKLRRLTDLVMCLLPFEEEWFRSRQVPAKFIGHPVINRELDTASIAARMRTLPSGSPRVLILPGSRSGEVKANLRVLVKAFIELADRNRGTAGLICAANERIARMCRELIGDMPTGLHIIVNDIDDIDAAIHWCDLALNVSGTVSLDLTRQQRPMVGVFRTGVVSWLGAKIMLRTPHRLLPNIIAQRRIVPEFVPAPPWLSANAIVEAAMPFLRDSRNVAIAAEELRRVVLRFHGKHPAEQAADLILRLMDGRPIDDPKPAAMPTVDPV